MKCRRRSHCARLILVAAALSGCALASGTAPRPPVESPAPAVPLTPAQQDRVNEFLDWAADQPEFIVVDKVDRRLSLYRFGRLVKSYDVVLGRNPGRKLFEGDRRTPSGVYRITDMRVHPKYQRFLALDYPNEDDLRHYRALHASASTERVSGSPGGRIGIHGSDKEELNDVKIDWTFGCVSLKSRDVQELYAAVNPGTPVLIADDQQP